MADIAESPPKNPYLKQCIMILENRETQAPKTCFISPHMICLRTPIHKMHIQFIITEALDVMLCFKTDIRIPSAFVLFFLYIYIELTINSLQDVYVECILTWNRHT